MQMLLKKFRDDYLEFLLDFLWREWTALGVAGQEQAALRHVIDPEALLLFTCTMGRYDQRLFDEVMDWLIQNGRFLNVQRLRNILRKEGFCGGSVLSAVADWLAQRGSPMKWKLLAREATDQSRHQSLFFLPDGQPMPPSKDRDTIFHTHGFIRNTLAPRGYAQAFPTNTTAGRLLQLRALFGVNARSDVLNYLALNGSGYPREVARELYYSQKAIHDVMTDLACSGVVVSARGVRERIFRIAPDSLPFLSGDAETASWINWPILLATAESTWHLSEELCMSPLEAQVAHSEILLAMVPLNERLTRTRWMMTLPAPKPGDGLGELRSFQKGFESVMR